MFEVDVKQMNGVAAAIIGARMEQEEYTFNIGIDIIINTRHIFLLILLLLFLFQKNVH